MTTHASSVVLTASPFFRVRRGVAARQRSLSADLTSTCPRPTWISVIIAATSCSTLPATVGDHRMAGRTRMLQYQFGVRFVALMVWFPPSRGPLDDGRTPGPALGGRAWRA